MSDVKKTLEILRTYGSKGVHSFVLNKLVGTIRSPARIDDLKKQGYSIVSKREEMDGAVGCRYFLNDTQTKKRKVIFNKDGTCTVNMI